MVGRLDRGIHIMATERQGSECERKGKLQFPSERFLLGHTSYLSEPLNDTVTLSRF